METTLTSPRRRALVVGVDKFANLPHARLDGCVHDAREMARVLRDRFEVPEESLTLLLDEQATREAILGAMDRLAAETQDGDVVIFHYSGHGSQVKDLEGDEPDGWDETILPHDTGRAPLPNRDITDDEIQAWLLGLAKKTPYVTLIFDCCHSGTITRDDPFRPRPRARWVKPDPRDAERFGGEPRPRLREYNEGSVSGASGWLPPSERHVLIAGCRNEEVASEVQTPGGSHGALTFHLLQELENACPGATYADVFEPAAQRVTRDLPNQHPQLEGARDRELFGLASFQPLRHVPVGKRSGNVVVLPAGAASGLAPESVWAVHPAGLRSLDGRTPLGRLRVRAVRGATSTADILEETSPGAIQEGLWAVEESGCLEDQLAVAVHPLAEGSGHVAEMLRAVAASQLLDLVPSPEPAEAVVSLVPPRSSAGEDDPVPEVGPLAKATWVVVERDGLWMPPRPADGPGAVRIVVENLEKRARRRRALELRNPESALRGKVSLNVLRRVPPDGWEEVAARDGEIELREGELFCFEMVNGHTEPLFVYLLDFGLAGGIQQIYPHRGAHDPLRAGERVLFGNQPGRELELFIPAVFPYAGAPEGVRRDAGTAVLKLVASTHDLNLRGLEQTAFRDEGGTRPAGRAAERLWSAALRGTREFQQASPGEDWTTLELTLRVRRREPPDGPSTPGGRAWVPAPVRGPVYR